jgi:hypothetical protein
MKVCWMMQRMDERKHYFCKRRGERRKPGTAEELSLQSQLLDGCAGGLMGDIRYYDPQEPAIYAEEEDTGYPEPWHKGRFSEEFEQVSLL